MQHEPPCEPLKKCRTETSDRLTNIENDIKSMKDDVCAMKDILETWNNTKGFVTTIKIISKVAVWIGITSAAFTGIYHAIRHFGQS